MNLPFFDPVTVLEKIKNKNTLHPTKPTQAPLDLNLSGLSGMSGITKNEKNILQIPQDDLPDLSEVWPQPRRCPTCHHWQEVPDRQWWRGECSLDGATGKGRAEVPARHRPVRGGAMKLVVDNREQVPYRFEAEQYQPVSIETNNLTTGDYSLQGFESYIAIERKSLADLTGRPREVSARVSTWNGLEVFRACH